MKQAKIIGISNETIEFLVPSSRNGYHNVTYNRATDSWTCTCEHHYFRIAYCKHMEQAKQVLNELNSKIQESKKISNPYNGTIKNCAEMEE